MAMGSYGIIAYCNRQAGFAHLWTDTALSYDNTGCLKLLEILEIYWNLKSILEILEIWNLVAPLGNFLIDR